MITRVGWKIFLISHNVFLFKYVFFVQFRIKYHSTYLQFYLEYQQGVITIKDEFYDQAFNTAESTVINDE